MKMYRWFFILSFFCLAEASAKAPYLVINHHANEGRGFFSIMDYVFTCIDWMETHPEDYSGFEVDFQKRGIYYDPKYGPNYWNYYFKPCKIGTPADCNTQHTSTEIKGLSPFHNEGLDKFLVNERVQRYIELNDELSREIQDFTDLHFRDKYVIGIHYRGTDKKYEARRLTYQTMLEEILDEINRSPENWHLFIATDEQPFLDFMVKRFAGRVSYLPGIERSSGEVALHFHNSSPYLAGKSAVMDCVLLSKTNALLRTCSNLNRWSTYFNPLLNERELTKRNGH